MNYTVEVSHPADGATRILFSCLDSNGKRWGLAVQIAGHYPQPYGFIRGLTKTALAQFDALLGATKNQWEKTESL